MGSLIFDISNFSETLYKESLDLFQCFKIFNFNEVNHKLQETQNADEIRLKLIKERQIRPMWISFSVGYELLFKAVLSRHQALKISSSKVSRRMDTIPNKKIIPQVIKVYDFVKSTLVRADKNTYLQNNLDRYNISHLFDFNSGTIGSSLESLNKLENNKIITPTERNLLKFSSQTIIDVRRNIDAHTFYGLTVSKDINGDLSDVYLPAINLLIDVYHR